MVGYLLGGLGFIGVWTLEGLCQVGDSILRKIAENIVQLS
jgi:hypothetical protein